MPLDEDRPLLRATDSRAANDQANPATAKDHHQRKSITTQPTQTEFFPLDPRAEDVHLLDIARAIAMKVRYTGHVTQFYSVAQHSVFVADILDRLGEDPEVQLLGLMHDTTEAYLPDVASTIKGHIVGFHALEAGVWAAIAERFDLAPVLPKIVKAADAEAYRFERVAVAPRPPWMTPIPCELDHEPLEEWLPREAEDLWLLEYHDLLKECKR